MLHQTYMKSQQQERRKRRQQPRRDLDINRMEGRGHLMTLCGDEEKIMVGLDHYFLNHPHQGGRSRGYVPRLNMGITVASRRVQAKSHEAISCMKSNRDDTNFDP